METSFDPLSPETVPGNQLPPQPPPPAQIPEHLKMKVIPGYKKKKIMTISDHPLIPSGVGTQARYVIEGLLRTGKYTVRSWGAAMKHPDYRPQKIFPEIYNEDWFIWPMDGYGDRDKMRSFILAEKPDVLLIVTDPRFYTWLFEMADEVLQNMPIVYWHVWDNDPTPDFNQAYYEGISGLAPLSLKTYGLVQDMERLGLYKGRYRYIPHAIPPETFKIVPEADVQRFRNAKFGPHADKKFILFWNNRNARRKMTGDIIDTFSQFMKVAGAGNVALLMQTQPKDPEGQDIVALAKKFGVDQNMIISEQRVPAEELNLFYNAADCTINIANNEGFGLGTLESLMCGTPIILHMTGGLQFQIGDWWEDQTFFGDQEKLTRIAKERWQKKQGNWWGIPIFPATRSCTGSQPIPYIYDDRVSHEDTVKALLKMYEMGRPARKALGEAARPWAMKNFNMETLVKSFDEFITETMESHRAPQPRIVSL